MWQPTTETPDVKRGKSTECWVAISFEARDYSKPADVYLPARNIVTKLEYVNAELTKEESDYWDDNGELPDGSPSDLEHWTNDDGEHCDYTGWVEMLGGDECRYYLIRPDDNGYVKSNSRGGRFKILAWQPIIKPVYP